MSKHNENRPGYKQTKAGWIPEEWECVPFTRLFNRVRKPVNVEPNTVYREVGIRSHCKGVFFKEQLFGKALGNKRVFWCVPGTLVFNIVFAWEQAIAILGPETEGLIASHRFPMYKAKTGRAHELFYLWFFSSKRGKYGLTLASPGGAGRNKTLGQGELDFLFLPKPPLSEQKKIADILSAWDSAINLTRRLIDAKQRLKKGLMQKLLTGRTRFPEFGEVVQEKGEIPDGWKECRLHDIGEISFSGVDKKTNQGHKTVFLCNYMDVYNNEYITNNIDFMASTASKQEIKKFSLQYGDVIITKDSETPDDIGVPAVVTNKLENVICGYHLALIRPNIDIVDPLFLAKEIGHYRVSKQLTRLANGAIRFGLTTHSVKNLCVWVPPIDEQNKISKLLYKCDMEILKLSKVIELYSTQKKGLMQKLLSGEVRVKTE